MTSEELDRIEARANAATPGPWIFYVNAHHEKAEARPQAGCSVDSRAPERELVAAGRHRDPDGDFYDDCVADSVITRADADFIAHARQDVPALVAEVRRLRAKLEGAPATTARTAP